MNDELKAILSRSTWTDSSIDLLIHEIVEYDMSDGGFSMIQEHKLLPPDLIRKLAAMPKGLVRNTAVGKLKYDKTHKGISKALEDGFRYYRLRFGVENELSPEDILSVKRDAIFTKRYCFQLQFGDFVQFKEKNVYQAYLYLELQESGYTKKKIEFYWAEDHKLDVKGIKNDTLEKYHRNYTLDVIWKFMRYLVQFDDKGALRYIVSMMEKYKNLELEPGYYREFTDASTYPYSLNGRLLQVQEVGPSELEHCLRHYNYMQIYVQLLNLVSKPIK